MNGIIKKIKDIFPVTTTKAVYIDGTNKTLQEAMDNGELGSTTQVSTSGRGYPMICIREKIYVKPVPTSNGVGHEFVTGGIVNFIRTPSGGFNYFNLPKSVVLGVGQAYVYDYISNSFEIRGTSGQNEYTACSSTEVILYSNYGGIAQGVLSDWFVTCDDDNIPIKEADCESLAIKTTQGIFIVGNYLYTCEHSDDEHTTTAGIKKYDLSTNSVLKTYSHNLGHLNSCDYSAEKDMLLTGNSSKKYDLTPQLFIFKNWSTVLENNTTLDFYTLDKIVITFSDFANEYKWNFAWGKNDTIWASCCDVRILRKITLNKGADGQYDGTYTIDGTWYSEKSDIIGGLIYYKGFLYAGVKGDYGIRKINITDGIKFNSEYIHPTLKSGDMQGLAIYDNKMICVSDSNCTKIPLSEL